MSDNEATETKTRISSAEDFSPELIGKQVKIRDCAVAYYLRRTDFIDNFGRGSVRDQTIRRAHAGPIVTDSYDVHLRCVSSTTNYPGSLEWKQDDRWLRKRGG